MKFAKSVFGKFLVFVGKITREHKRMGDISHHDMSVVAVDRLTVEFGRGHDTMVHLPHETG